jgi:hypothetical protein
MERFIDSTRRELGELLRPSSAQGPQGLPYLQTNLHCVSSSRPRTLYINALQDKPDEDSEDPFWATLSPTRTSDPALSFSSILGTSPSPATQSLRAALASSPSSPHDSIALPDDVARSSSLPSLRPDERPVHRRRSSAHAALMSVRRCKSGEGLDSPPHRVKSVASTSSSPSFPSLGTRPSFSSLPPPSSPNPLSPSVPPILEDNEELEPGTETTMSRPCKIRPSRSMSPLPHQTPPLSSTPSITTRTISEPAWLPQRARLRESGQASARERLPRTSLP